MPTQLERRTATRESIIDAVVGLYLEQPAADPTLEAVAEQSGVAKATILYHFESRMGLLRAVAEHLGAERAERLGPPGAYVDAPAFVRRFLEEARDPSALVYQRIADQVRYATPDAGVGGDVHALIEILQHLGVSERPMVTAAAVEMMFRQVTLGQVDPAGVERFVDELFDLDHSADRA